MKSPYSTHNQVAPARVRSPQQQADKEKNLTLDAESALRNQVQLLGRVPASPRQQAYDKIKTTLKKQAAMFQHLVATQMCAEKLAEKYGLEQEEGRILLSPAGFKECLRALNLKLTYEDMCRFRLKAKTRPQSTGGQQIKQQNSIIDVSAFVNHYVN